MVHVRVSQATYRTTLQQIGVAFESGKDGHSAYATHCYTTALRILLAVNGLEATR